MSVELGVAEDQLPRLEWLGWQSGWVDGWMDDEVMG